MRDLGVLEETHCLHLPQDKIVGSGKDYKTRTICRSKDCTNNFFFVNSFIETLQCYKPLMLGLSMYVG